jgi:hypothetical protein
MVEDDISVWEFAAYVFNYSIHKFWDCGRSVHGVLAGEQERQVACGGDVECGHRGQSFRCRGCMVQGVPSLMSSSDLNHTIRSRGAFYIR